MAPTARGGMYGGGMEIATKSVRTLSFSLVAALALTGCPDQDSAPAGADLGVDLGAGADLGPPVDAAPAIEAGALPCGSHQVFAADCPSRCPAPCRCELLVWDPTSGPFSRWACARPCAEPWHCPGSERCAYLNSQPKSDAGARAVCVPGSYKTPDLGSPASIDCFFFPFFGQLTCQGKHLVQYQAANLTGGYRGCVTVRVVQATCAGGCIKPDAGAARCAGPDMGPVAWPDLGAKPGCCPTGSVLWNCTRLGGAKVPGHPCRLQCCKGSCKGTKSTDKHGCEVWTLPPPDAGSAQ